MKANRKARLLEELPKKRCRYCLKTERLSYDHKVPLIKGGKDNERNLQVLCVMCNGMKSAMTHKQVLTLARWIYQINVRRIRAGKKPLGIRGKDVVRDIPNYSAGVIERQFLVLNPQEA